MLHTPLMSGANFIHGIVIVGAILVLGTRTTRSRRPRVRGSGARDRERRRRLVRDRPHARNVQAAAGAEAGEERVISDPDVTALLYLVTIVCFIVALRFLSSPKHARKGNWVGGAGMLVAIGTTLLLDGIENWVLIVVGLAIGTVVGVVGARNVRMTAMPQMVAIFNGVGGGAAALVALAECTRRSTAAPATRPCPSCSPRSSARSRSRARRSRSRSCRSSSAGARSCSRPERRQRAVVLGGRRRSGSRRSPASRASGSWSP